MRKWKVKQRIFFWGWNFTKNHQCEIRCEVQNGWVVKWSLWPSLSKKKNVQKYCILFNKRYAYLSKKSDWVDEKCQFFLFPGMHTKPGTLLPSCYLRMIVLQVLKCPRKITIPWRIICNSTWHHGIRFKLGKHCPRRTQSSYLTLLNILNKTKKSINDTFLKKHCKAYFSIEPNLV